MGAIDSGLDRIRSHAVDHAVDDGCEQNHGTESQNGKSPGTSHMRAARGIYVLFSYLSLLNL